VLEEFRKRAEGAWKVLDTQLGRAPYLAGGRLTIADISACAYLFFEDELGVSWTQYPNIDRWLGRLRAEPAGGILTRCFRHPSRRANKNEWARSAASSIRARKNSSERPCDGGLVADLRAKVEYTAQGGEESARAKHLARGKLLPRERLRLLLDPGSPFLELSPLAAFGVYEDEAPGAGIITGVGRVSGRECVAVVNDATVKGGTYYPITVKKHLRAQEDRPAEPASPACLSRLTRAARSYRSRTAFFPTRSFRSASSTTRRRSRPAGIPQIAAVMGSCTAGGV